MIFSVLHGQNCCPDNLLGKVLPSLVGRSDITDMVSDLENLRYKIEKAYDNYISKRSSMKVPLTDNEIDKYISYGLDKMLLYTISTAPQTMLGADFMYDENEMPTSYNDSPPPFPGTDDVPSLYTDADFPPFPGIDINDDIPNEIGIYERDRELVEQDFDNSARATAAKKLMSQINAILESQTRPGMTSSNNTALIVVIIVIAIALFYRSDKVRL